MSNLAPKVSVIVSTYNHKQYLGQALDSIFAQTYRNYEVIVVDDGSTDGTSEWVQTCYPQVRVFQLPANRGAAAAKNTGICNCLGSLIAFLDSDDRWHPDYLQYQVQALEARPDAVLVYCNYVQRLLGSSQSAKVNLKPAYEDLTVSMLLDNFIHTPSGALLRAAVFQKVGLLDERLSICHDRELYLRLFKHGSPVHVAEYLVQKFWLPNSLVTRSNCQDWLMDGLKLLEIFYSQPENSRYLHLRPSAEANLRSRVESSRQYFAHVFGCGVSERQFPTRASSQGRTTLNDKQVHPADY